MAHKSIEKINNIKKGLIYTAKQSPEFKKYKEYFVEELGFSFITPSIHQVKIEDNELVYVISFTIEDGREDTEASLSLTLDEGEIIDSWASFDYYTGDGDVYEVKKYIIKDDEIVSESISI